MTTTNPEVEAPPDALTAFTGRFATANHYRVPPWEARMARIVELMTSANAHWFGTQETEELAERGIVDGIQPAGAYTVWSDKSNLNILGRNDLFNLLWHREYAMAGDNRNRYYQIAVVEHIDTKVKVAAVNAHFSNGSMWAAVRVGQAQAIVATLIDLVNTNVIDEDTPIILTGDFNDKLRANTPGSPAAIFKAAGLIDARDVVGMVSRIDVVYGRNVTFRAWSRIETGFVSDHDWYVVTADVGIGAPKTPPPLVPVSKPVIVTMYVRPTSDPVWNEPPYEIWNRVSADKLGSVKHVPGDRIVGTIVTQWGGEYLKTSRNSNFYNVKYLTMKAPS